MKVDVVSEPVQETEEIAEDFADVTPVAVEQCSPAKEAVEELVYDLIDSAVKLREIESVEDVEEVEQEEDYVEIEEE